MKLKSKLPEYTIVIATLGEEVLLNTLYSLNKGDYIPKEIIVSLPKGKKISSQLKKIENVKIIISPLKGQVPQRVFGFKKASHNFVLQLDDDTIISTLNIKKLITNLIQLGPGNAISPIVFDIEKNESVTLLNKNIINFAYDIFHYVILGSRWGLKKMGTIGKSGIAYGVDPLHIPSKTLFKREWLSGCCVAMFKQDLVLHNYYPFKGKAYFEDVIHSILLRKKNVKLWTLNGTKCYTKIIDTHINYFEIDKHFEAQKYVVSLLNYNKVQYYLWLLVFRIKIFIYKKNK